MSYLNMDATSRSLILLDMVVLRWVIGFWDDQNQKILIIRNLIFNEEVLYKHITIIDSRTDKSKEEKIQYVSLPRLRLRI